jgi:hypothetical protein
MRLHERTKTARGGLRRLDEIRAIVRRHGGRSLPDAFLLPAALEHHKQARLALTERRLAAALGQESRAVRWAASFVLRRLAANLRLR